MRYWGESSALLIFSSTHTFLTLPGLLLTAAAKVCFQLCILIRCSVVFFSMKTTGLSKALPRDLPRTQKCSQLRSQLTVGNAWFNPGFIELIIQMVSKISKSTPRQSFSFEVLYFSVSIIVLIVQGKLCFSFSFSLLQTPHTHSFPPQLNLSLSSELSL